MICSLGIPRGYSGQKEGRMDIWVIWEYSASITVIGLLIWLIKLIFHDKLDARWHYI